LKYQRVKANNVNEKTIHKIIFGDLYVIYDLYVFVQYLIVNETVTDVY